MRDGAVLPILHLNGYKIANPTVLARIAERRAARAARGLRPRAALSCRGDDPADVHQQLAAALDEALDEIAAIQRRARDATAIRARPRWPMIVLRTPKGWTGPQDRRRRCRSRARGGPTRCRWPALATNPEHLRDARGSGCAATGPRSCSTTTAGCGPSSPRWRREGERRMGANPHANGGVLLRDLDLPDFREYAVDVPAPGATTAEPTRVLGGLLRDVMRRNAGERNFRHRRPRRDRVQPARSGVRGDRPGVRPAEILPGDDHLAPDGRVMEVLSEHLCQGWLEGYLLTGRHGLFTCYEAFIHIVDSMFNQHAKWLKVTAPHPVAAADRLAELPAHLARLAAGPQRLLAPGPGVHRPRGQQEGRGRAGLPAARRQHAAVASPTTACAAATTSTSSWPASSRAPNWLTMDEAVAHCTRGDRHLGVGRATTPAGEPDVVLACAGDVPTLEALAAADLLRQHLPDLKVRVVNVVDLMRLQPATEHPHGLSRRATSTRSSRPTGRSSSPSTATRALIHRLTYRRTNHDNIHVRGYKEEGTTTTPFDMVMLNDLDRFHLVDGRDRPGARARPQRAAAVRQQMVDQRAARTAPTPASTARTRPRCATGSGRRGERRARPGRQRRVEQPQAAAARRRRPAGRRSTTSTRAAARTRRATSRARPLGCGAGRRGRPPGGARRHRFTAPVLVDDGVRGGARGAGRPGAAAPAEVARGARRRARGAARTCPHVACFDTAFHATLPAAAATYALPAEWRERLGVRRYGFHGLSHAYASRRAAELLGRPLASLRLVTCHLGAGASLAAVARRPLASTRPWASRRSTAWSWRPAAAASTRPGAVAAAAHGLRADELDDALEHRVGPRRPGRHAPTCARC